jgi:hypothetical protein
MAPTLKPLQVSVKCRLESTRARSEALPITAKGEPHNYTDLGHLFFNTLRGFHSARLVIAITAICLTALQASWDHGTHYNTT